MGYNWETINYLNTIRKLQDVKIKRLLRVIVVHIYNPALHPHGCQTSSLKLSYNSLIPEGKHATLILKYWMKNNKNSFTLCITTSSNNLLPRFQKQIPVGRNGQVEGSNQKAGKRSSTSYFSILPYDSYQRKKVQGCSVNLSCFFCLVECTFAWESKQSLGCSNSHPGHISALFNSWCLPGIELGYRGKRTSTGSKPFHGINCCIFQHKVEWNYTLLQT